MSEFDPQNFYYATTPPPPPHAALKGETRADVCIVGGGISGLSAALHLAERGFSVALLEAQHLGFGGSGRSGGQTIFGYASGQEKLEKLVGKADARLMWDIALEGMKLQRELIARHSIACDYVAGHMHVGVKARHDAELRAEVESLHEHYDYRSVRLIGRDELRTLVAQRALHQRPLRFEQRPPSAIQVHAGTCRRRRARRRENLRELGGDQARARGHG